MELLDDGTNLSENQSIISTLLYTNYNNTDYTDTNPELYTPPPSDSFVVIKNSDIDFPPSPINVDLKVYENKCSCNNLQIIHHKGKVICTNCGQILEESISDNTAEWRNFGHDDNANQQKAKGQRLPFMVIENRRILYIKRF